MSDFFEKENGLEENPDTPVQEESAYKDEYAQYETIFGDPAKKAPATAKNPNKKRIITIISAFLAVVVLAVGTFSVIKLIPKKNQDDDNTSSSAGISLLDVDADLFSKVTVTNKNGKFVFTSERKKVEKTESSTESTPEYETVWTLEGLDSSVIDSYLVADIFVGLEKLSATRKVTAMSLSDCGLDNPTYTLDIESEKYGKFSISIGNYSKDNMGVYLKLSTKEEIYLVPNDIAMALEFTAVDLADVTDIEILDIDNGELDNYLSESSLVAFDKLYVSGNNFKTPLTIGMNNDAFLGGFMPYLITSPVKREAGDLSSILSIFRNGVSADAAYAMDVSAESIKKFKLDNPDIVFKIEVAGQSLTYKFSKIDNQYCAMVTSKSKIIKKVSFENLPFIKFTSEDLYSPFMWLRAVDDIKEMTFNVGGKTHKFEIDYDHGENMEIDTDDTLKVKYNGKDIDANQFENFFKVVIGTQNTDFDVSKLKETPEMKIVIKYIEKYNRTETLTFTRSSATTYQYALNGKETGRISSSNYSRIVTALNRITK